MTTVEDCKLLRLPRVERREGNITPLESEKDIPFPIARVYYLYDIPGGEARGAHAHVRLEQLLVSVMGSFRVRLDDGEREREVELNRGYLGLYLPELIWRELKSFSSGGICLVLASRPYMKNDYVRDYDEFLCLKREAGADG
jgi:hypothetical protein